MLSLLFKENKTKYGTIMREIITSDAGNISCSFDATREVISEMKQNRYSTVSKQDWKIFF